MNTANDLTVLRRAMKTYGDLRVNGTLSQIEE